MVILEGPYVSDFMCEYLEEQQVPAFRNEFTTSLKRENLHLVESNEMTD